MVEIGNPFTKDEILDALRSVNQATAQYFTSLTPEQFFAHPPGVWSPAENVEHLILAVTPRVESLRGSRESLREQYGAAEKPSRHYAEIRETYLNILANGGAAGPSVIPNIDDHPADPQVAQDELIQRWKFLSVSLVDAASNWSETDLDLYQVEHRLLGLMTVRELLLWTTYHNLHHMEDARRLVEGQ
jgi:hypothetical protein